MHAKTEIRDSLVHAARRESELKVRYRGMLEVHCPVRLTVNDRLETGYNAWGKANGER